MLRDVVGLRRGVRGGVDKLQLRLGVDLYWLRVEDLDGDAQGMLCGEELARHGRYRFQKDRDLYLARRVLERRVLSEYGARGRPIVNAYGRPEVEGGGLSFSLSSSGGLAVCAVTRRGVVGMDVEKLGRETEVAVPVLAAEERERLEGLPENERGDAFLRLWTLKEAYAKARGLGLSLPVEQVSFDYERAGGIGVRFGAGIEDDAARWQFEQVRLLGRYVVAVGLPVGSSGADRLLA